MTAIRPTERVTARITQQMRVILDQAAELTGATLNQFMVQAAFEKAREVVDRERILTLSQKDAECFFQALETPPEANDCLKDAIARYKESDLYEAD